MADPVQSEINIIPTMAGLSTSKRTIMIDPDTGGPVKVLHPGKPEPIPTTVLYSTEDGSKIIVNTKEVSQWLSQGYSKDKPRHLLDAEALVADEAAELAAMQAQAAQDAVVAFKKRQADRAKGGKSAEGDAGKGDKGKGGKSAEG